MRVTKKQYYPVFDSIPRDGEFHLVETWPESRHQAQKIRRLLSNYKSEAESGPTKTKLVKDGYKYRIMVNMDYVKPEKKVSTRGPSIRSLVFDQVKNTRKYRKKLKKIDIPVADEKTKSAIRTALAQYYKPKGIKFTTKFIDGYIYFTLLP